MGLARLVICSFLFTAVVATAFGQGPRDDERDKGLAEHYFEQGYFEQAAQLYERLFNYKGNELIYYEPYFASLLALKDYEGLEKMVKKTWKTAGGNPVYLVDLVYVYEQSGNIKAADKQMNDIIATLPANRYVINEVANKLFVYNKTDAAARVFIKGNELLKDPYAFAPQQAYVAQLKNDLPQVIQIFVDWAANRQDYIPDAQNGLQRVLKEPADFDALEKVLLKRVQADKQNIAYPELLVWLYMQRNDFESAMLQARSLDALNNEDGSRIIRIARTANTNKDYETAAKGYKYIINKGQQHPYYITATLELINTQRDRITYTTTYTNEDLFDLRASYQKFIGDYRTDMNTIQAAREMGKLEAFYLHRPDSAMAILERLLEQPGVDLKTRSEIKLDLGDYYLMSGDVWEPVLLYTQVDKDFKGSPLGEMAKFKNAKLSYYKGDFEWSQTQLRVIKASTSELISNDAIDLSVFIIDNTTIDTNPEPMQLFADADLLYYQNKPEEALAKLDELEKNFPAHRLEDDVYFLKYRIFFSKKDFTESVRWLEKVLQEYDSGILGDNALFALGELYENQLSDKEKAKAYYERIILDHGSSVFVVEARKRYRKLRGDSVN